MDNVSMKTCVLASGSKGNCTYVASATTKILADLGTTSLYVEKKLKDINVDPNKIDAIVISHTHSDHINGLKVFVKKYHTMVYLTEKMYQDIKEIFPLTDYEIIDGDFQIGDISISVIKTSHDVSDSNGYIFENNDKSVVYVTDTGYINQKNHKRLTNKNVYVFESNHDIKMLMEGSYPYHLKQRILGDKGHLSNKDSAYYLSKFIGDKTDTIILSHLSHENNDPKIALKTLQETLQANNISFNHIMIATQEDRTEVVEV
jgi:phosphoribosyl 1,2-cyclic phosphodiesterase